MAIIRFQDLFTLPALIAAAKGMTAAMRFAPGGRTRVFPSHQFEGLGALERNWQTIRGELDRVLEAPQKIPRFQQVHERYTVVQAWKTYILYGYGWRVERNCRECPETAALLAQVPHLRTAMFSVLPPHTKIPPHVGIYAGVLRYHLGLKVPHPELCGMRVDTEQVQWREGEGFVFDNTYEHQAWNDSDALRVVLFMDFDRPLPAPLVRPNRWVIAQIARTGFMETSKKNLDAFYAKADEDARSVLS